MRIEGCETCHIPHGSMNAKLLRRPVVFTLCLECHNGSASGLTGGGVPLQTSRHNLLRSRNTRGAPRATCASTGRTPTSTSNGDHDADPILIWL